MPSHKVFCSELLVLSSHKRLPFHYKTSCICRCFDLNFTGLEKNFTTIRLQYTINASDHHHKLFCLQLCVRNRLHYIFPRHLFSFMNKTVYLATY